MAKLPYIQFYSGDWLKDPNLTMCSPVTRGIWIDFICVMHESDRSGVISGSREQLARLGRCSAVDLNHALIELNQNKAADVTERNSIVTVINRRMKREFLERKCTKERVNRYRKKDCNGSVTPDIHIQSHIQSNNTLSHAPAREGNLISEAFEQSGIPGKLQDAPESTFESLPMPSVGLGGFRQEKGEPDSLFTKQDCIDTGQLAGLTEEQSTDFYIHYAAQGWKLGNGLPIVDLPSAMTRWKNKGFKFDTGGNGKKPKSSQPTMEEYQRNLAEMTRED